ncbi:hypothetical protein TNCV_633421, partial [Trichonephila clavipes]
MFEILDSVRRRPILVCSKGKNGTNPGTWANNVIYFMLPKGNPMMDLRELNGMIAKREVLVVVGNPAVYLQVDDHVHPGNCPDGVLPSPAELGFRRNWKETDVAFFIISDLNGADLENKRRKSQWCGKYRNSVHVG